MSDKEEIEIYVQEYIQSLKEHEKEAYTIAKQQLQSSFSLEKSIGFKRYVEERKKKKCI